MSAALNEGVPLEDAGGVHRVAPHIRPDAKAQRYDRQLRLWAASGQTRLERARILVGPANATAAQILKNIILPGVGTFTICDPASVSAADVGNNFFLDASSLGKSRAQEVARLVCELNPAVRGHCISKTLAQVVEEYEDELLREGTLVIAVNASETEEIRMADRCWRRNVPFCTVQTNGLAGLLRVQVEEHTVVESHPDSLEDLRLDAPFPALVDYVGSLDFNKMNAHEHGHVPAIAILVRFLQHFKSEHGGRLPSNVAEREELKRAIIGEKRSADEENFDEALAMVWKACRPSAVPSSVNDLCKACPSTRTDASLSTFWLLVRALRAFLASAANTQNLLPLPGVLPDMKADTQRYVALQQIYRQKANQDVALLTAELSRVLHDSGLPTDAVSHDEISVFAKHAAVLKVFRSRRLSAEYAAPLGLADLLQGEPNSMDQSSPCAFYIAMRAANRFRDQNERYPGSLPSDTEQAKDILAMEELARRLVSSSMGSDDAYPQPLEDACAEIVRAGGTELPQIAALVGGMVAQEVIKVITSQYTPLDATCVFDGIRSTTGVLRL